MTLLAFATKRRAAVWRVSIDIACPAGPAHISNPPYAAAAVNRRNRQTDGQMDCYRDHATYNASSVKNAAVPSVQLLLTTVGSVVFLGRNAARCCTAVDGDVVVLATVADGIVLAMVVTVTDDDDDDDDTDDGN